MLSINHLTHVVSNNVLLSKLSFEAKPGQLIQIQGANGSGKTTLLKLIAGIKSIHYGDVTWQNISIKKQKEQFANQIIYLGHKRALKDHLTVNENLNRYRTLFDFESTQSNQTYLEQIGLRNFSHKKANTLSAGQKQRLALTRFLGRYRPIWLLDEPLTAMDNSGKNLLYTWLEQHRKKNGIVIINTHQLIELPHVQTIHLPNPITVNEL